eukprot:sb/3471819/
MLQVRKACQKEGELWTDPSFPPNEQSLWGDGSPTVEDVTWMRLRDINPKGTLIVKKSMEDVQQGALGNCWLVASVVCLASRGNLLKRVLPSHKKQDPQGKEYQGCFLFRFYRLGDWIEVVIDDWLPTRNGKLIFMHSSDKEQFWPALLEKAYAKLAHPRTDPLSTHSTNTLRTQYPF